MKLRDLASRLGDAYCEAAQADDSAEFATKGRELLNSSVYATTLSLFVSDLLRTSDLAGSVTRRMPDNSPASAWEAVCVVHASLSPVAEVVDAEDPNLYDEVLERMRVVMACAEHPKWECTPPVERVTRSYGF